MLDKNEIYVQQIVRAVPRQVFIPSVIFIVEKSRFKPSIDLFTHLRKTAFFSSKKSRLLQQFGISDKVSHLPQQGIIKFP